MITDYKKACEVHRSIDGRAITQQCFHLLLKIREVDSLLRLDAELRSRVFEVHPEVSFALWNRGLPMQSRKKSRAGKQERTVLIESLWPDLVSILRSQLPRSGYGLDDLHDAIAALWSIERHQREESKRIPEADQRDPSGLQMRING
jgi:predicted RNase H-like nuclease